MCQFLAEPFSQVTGRTGGLKLVESHSQNQNDQKKRLYSRQTKVIAYFRGVIHTTNSTSTYKAGFEPGFEPKGAGALQKGQ